MRLFKILLLLLVSFVLLAAHSSAMKAAPEALLAKEEDWQTQGGSWNWDGATVKGTAGETLAELGSLRSLPLRERWLSLRVQLEGEMVKAGLWFSGVRDGKGAPLRLIAEAVSGALTNGRGTTIATLPEGAMQGPVDLVLTFQGSQMRISHGGKVLAEVEVSFEEATATPNLLVERGAAVFAELLVGTSAPRAEVAIKPQMQNAAVASPLLSVDATGAEAVPLKGRWEEYFGVHEDVMPGPWRMVRQPDGPTFGFPPTGKHGGPVEQFPGPFAKVPVDMGMADLRDWKRKESVGMDVTLPSLLERGMEALYIAPWRSRIGPREQDEIWALMKLTYGRHTGAEGRLFFQWGDDINYTRPGMQEDSRTRYSAPRNGAPPSRGANAMEAAAIYAEHFLAPAVEAVRLASREIYQDERRIPIVLGSCAKASMAESRQWYQRVLEHKLEAASFQGKTVIEIVDYLTVNYPFSTTDGGAALQEWWDRYGASVKGLWVTEEYGAQGRGVAELLRNTARFSQWVAKNQLNGQQARLLWNLPNHRRDGEEIGAMVRRLGDFFGKELLRLRVQPTAGGELATVSCANGRVLVIHLPAPEKARKKSSLLGGVSVAVDAAQLGGPWVARFIQAKERRATLWNEALPALEEAGRLKVSFRASSNDVWAVLLEKP